MKKPFTLNWTAYGCVNSSMFAAADEALAEADRIAKAVSASGKSAFTYFTVTDERTGEELLDKRGDD